MVAMLVAAEKATLLPREGKPNIKLSVAASQTVLFVFVTRKVLGAKIIEKKKGGGND